jgi:Esterase/lipase
MNRSKNYSLDLYQPQNIESIGPQPTIVWIHGGGWISGSKEHARGYFKLLAAQGYNVVSVQYQFAPQAIYPSQLHQIDQALEFITQHAAEYQIDAEFISGRRFSRGEYGQPLCCTFNKSRLCQTIGFSTLSATFPA